MTRLLPIALLLVGCKTSEPADPPETPAPTPAAETASATPAAEPEPSKPAPITCAATPTWRHEPIALPPEFAPTMPAGNETLFFAPGMFDATSAEYWSYVFLMTFDAPGPRDVAGLTTLLTDYYRGLISAVAKGKKMTIDPASIRVEVKSAAPGSFTATVDLIDAFVSGKPLTVHLDVAISADGKCLSAAASPSADRSSPTWAALAKARTCVSCN